MSVKLFLDTETTGLPEANGNDFPSKYYSPRNLDKYQNSRVLGIGLVLQDEKLQTEEYRTIIKLDKNVQISSEAQKVHRLSWQDCNKKGIPIQTALNDLERFIDRSDLIVAHNINFDINVILAECYRNGNNRLAEKIKTKEKFCTFATNNNISLKNLALRLGIDTNSFKFHDALDDAKICRLCYLKQRKDNTVPKASQIVSKTKPITTVKIRKIVKSEQEQKISEPKLSRTETQIENYKKEISQLKKEIAQLKTQLLKFTKLDIVSDSEEESDETSEEEI